MHGNTTEARALTELIEIFAKLDRQHQFEAIGALIKTALERQPEEANRGKTY